mmetsp:Transcript_35068/g.99431  ORF Transcript_35068/g.99431 Transcript_35068/m.99431 type:complete len:214 (-) Transcript_35068:1408-2049(-)
MEVHHLVVLHREVVPGPLQVGDLGKEAGNQGLANVQVVVFGLEVCADHVDIEALADADQLLPHAVCRLEGAVVEEVVVAPGRVLAVLLEGMVDVEKSHVVAVNVCEQRFRLVGCLLLFPRTHERVWGGEHRADGHDLVGAPELWRCHDHLCHLRIERELGHHSPDVGEGALIVEGAKVVEQLQGPHESLGGGWVHEIKVHQVVNSKLLELENN